MNTYYENVYIMDKYSLLASTKYKPIVKERVNECIDDYYLKEKSVEEAECKYQEKTIMGLLSKYKGISLLISSDLQNQNICSTYASSNTNIPYLGIYAACSSFNEGLIISANIIEKNKNNIILSVSSHNLVSEKQFRNPVEYGAVRKKVNTLTATGSISVLLTNKKTNIKVESSTIGKVCKTNHKDTNDMGSAMAIACADTLLNHLKNTKRTPDYYDLILTGDLGVYGKEIMIDCFEKMSNLKLYNVIDAGSIFYTEENNYAGSSGPACLPLVLFDYILPQKTYNKILLLATGSLHSVYSSNLNKEIPSICHAVSLEVKY